MVLELQSRCASTEHESRLLRALRTDAINGSTNGTRQISTDEYDTAGAPPPARHSMPHCDVICLCINSRLYIWYRTPFTPTTPPPGTSPMESYLAAAAARAIDAGVPERDADARLQPKASSRGPLPPINAVAHTSSGLGPLPPIHAAAHASLGSLPPIDAVTLADAPLRPAHEQAALQADLDALASELGLKRGEGLGAYLKPDLSVPMPKVQPAVAVPSQQSAVSRVQASCTKATGTTEPTGPSKEKSPPR